MANGPILNLETGDVTEGEQPDPIAPTPTEHWVDGATFLGRLTDDEYTAVMGLAATNVTFARLIEDLRMIGRINLLGERAAAAKTALVPGILSADRANVIFS